MMTFAAVYAAAWTIAALHGTPPAVTIDPALGVYAETRPTQIAVSPHLYADATGTPQQRVDAAAALLHEFAHTRQNPTIPAWEREGGAEAFSADKDAQLRRRFGVLPVRWAYPWETRFVELVFGFDWIRKGQFA